MRHYTNANKLPLSVAVYLATDTYDHDPGTVSATALIKPVRQLILSKRVPPEEGIVDIVSLVKSRMGTAIHDAIEKAWLSNYQTAMRALGYPDSVIERVVINPKPGLVQKGQIPVYMEQREYREILGFIVSGKYDFIADGRLEDFKTTSTFTWINGNKEEDYKLQGSIYRWLNPKIITVDHMAIQMLFTDWMPGRAQAEEKYPNNPVEQLLIPLMSLDDTEDFITQKLRQVQQHQNTPEPDLPFCSDKDLWRKPPQYKYYKNPQKTARSTKNFDNPGDAYARLSKDGHVGKVVEVPGEVIACKYCAAFPVCKQKDDLIAQGALRL